MYKYEENKLDLSIEHHITGVLIQLRAIQLQRPSILTAMTYF